jgi:hypothetical protein
LQKILFGIETAKPYVFIDSLVVQPTPSSASANQAWETLRISLTASSYWRGPDANIGDNRSENTVP